MKESTAGASQAAVRVLRALRGWNQAELAEAAGMERGTIQRYESGEQEPPCETLVQIAAAVGVNRRRLELILLPAVRVLNENLDPVDEEPETLTTDGWNVEEAAERLSRELGEIGRCAALNFFADLERQELEAESEAWRPLPRHREEAQAIWRRLAGLSRDDQAFLIDWSEELHSWALAEHICHLSAEPAAEPERALELAGLAAQVADKVTGPEPWKARIRGYAAAHRAAAARRAGETQGAMAAAHLALRLWQEAEGAPETLEDERFRQALAAATG